MLFRHGSPFFYGLKQNKIFKKHYYIYKYV